MLDIAGLDSATFPGFQDLRHSLVHEPVPDGDGFTTPPEHKVQLDNPPLQIGPVVPFERGHRAWEANAVGANRHAQLIETQAIERTLVERRKGRPRTTVRPATVGHQRVVVPLHRSYNMHGSSVPLKPLKRHEEE